MSVLKMAVGSNEIEKPYLDVNLTGATNELNAHIGSPV